MQAKARKMLPMIHTEFIEKYLKGHSILLNKTAAMYSLDEDHMCLHKVRDRQFCLMKGSERERKSIFD